MRKREDFVSLILGLIIIGVIVGLVVNFVMKGDKGNIEVPGVSISSDEEKEYIVKRGDCLWRIAVLKYGDGFQWTKIWQANKDNIRDPNKIEIGMTLKIPTLGMVK